MHPTDSSTVTAVVDSLAEAWARGDGEAYGAHFTADASYVTFAGTLYRGRHDIAEAHTALFAKLLAGTRLAAQILEVRFLGRDVAILTASGDTHKGAPPKTLTKIQTYTLVRDGDRWLVAAFHNTRHKPLMERISFRLAPGSKPKAWQ